MLHVFYIEHFMHEDFYSIKIPKLDNAKLIGAYEDYFREAKRFKGLIELVNNNRCAVARICGIVEAAVLGDHCHKFKRKMIKKYNKKMNN